MFRSDKRGYIAKYEARREVVVARLVVGFPT
jgi:hypothetical protein